MQAWSRVSEWNESRTCLAAHACLNRGDGAEDEWWQHEHLYHRHDADLQPRNARHPIGVGPALREVDGNPFHAHCDGQTCSEHDEIAQNARLLEPILPA